MESQEIIDISQDAVFVLLKAAVPIMMVALLVGLIISLFQALTQIQEQTLGFVAKLIAVIVTIFATAGWLGHELYSFAELALLKIPQIQ